MTGRSGEVADALERRQVKVCCDKETRWKGEGTRITENLRLEGSISCFGKDVQE